MNLRPLIAAALLMTLPGGMALAATAPDAVPLAVAVGPGSWISLAGTSTLHPFTSRSTQPTVSATRRAEARDPANATAMVELATADAVRDVTVDVPVRTLLSGEGGLDKNLWKALKSEDHPRIRYRLAGYTLVPAGSPDTLHVRAEGTLEVAGVQRPVPLEVVALRGADGVVLEGTASLRMSDFGVKPPRLMLGALRVGDRVAIRYHLVILPHVPATQPPATAGREVGRP